MHVQYMYMHVIHSLTENTFLEPEVFLFQFLLIVQLIRVTVVHIHIILAAELTVLCSLAWSLYESVHVTENKTIIIMMVAHNVQE